MAIDLRSHTATGDMRPLPAADKPWPTSAVVDYEIDIALHRICKRTNTQVVHVRQAAVASLMLAEHRADMGSGPAALPTPQPPGKAGLWPASAIVDYEIDIALRRVCTRTQVPLVQVRQAAAVSLLMAERRARLRWGVANAFPLKRNDSLDLVR